VASEGSNLRSLKRPKIRNHGCGDSGFSFSVSLTSKYLISTGYSINSDCPIINIRQNGQKLDFIGTLKASEIDRIRTMIVKEDVKTGMITIYTGGDECLTIFRQVEETEKDSIYALRLKSMLAQPEDTDDESDDEEEDNESSPTSESLYSNLIKTYCTLL